MKDDESFGSYSFMDYEIVQRNIPEHLPYSDILSFGSVAGYFQDSTLDKTRPQDHLSCLFGGFYLDIIPCTTSTQVLKGVHREQVNFQ